MEQSDIQKYIDDGIEESLILEYKAAEALGATDGKKKEITKDVSAMANSAGGIIIYGVKEFNDDDRKHLPESIDTINRTEFSKERLEQIINNIRPRIDGLIIYSVDIISGANDVIYVVDIPKSNTAHQATDHRYYKRFNFLSAPMEDYEVRDVMARQQYPKFTVSFAIEMDTKYERDSYDFTKGKTYKTCDLKIRATNIGTIYAHYVNCFVYIPKQLLSKSVIDDFKYDKKEIPEHVRFYENNTVRDIVDVQFSGLQSINKYGPSRFDPILPKLSHNWSISINEKFPDIDYEDLEILWEIYADNAPVEKGSISVDEINVSDKR